MSDPHPTHEGGGPFVDLAPTLSNPLTQRYVLMHYGLSEPRLDACAISAHFQAHPLTVDEAQYIAANWNA